MLNRLYLRIDGVFNSEQRLCEIGGGGMNHWWSGYGIDGAKIEVLNRAHRLVPFEITLLPSWRLSMWSVKRHRGLLGDMGLAPFVNDMAAGGPSDKDAAVNGHILKIAALGLKINAVILDASVAKYGPDLAPRVVEISRVYGLRTRDAKRIMKAFQDGYRDE